MKEKIIKFFKQEGEQKKFFNFFAPEKVMGTKYGCIWDGLEWKKRSSKLFVELKLVK